MYFRSRCRAPPTTSGPKSQSFRGAKWNSQSPLGNGSRASVQTARPLDSVEIVFLTSCCPPVWSDGDAASGADSQERATSTCSFSSTLGIVEERLWSASLLWTVAPSPVQIRHRGEGGTAGVWCAAYLICVKASASSPPALLGECPILPFGAQQQAHHARARKMDQES